MGILLKLVREKSHAEMLLQGKLFMRPAAYYHYLEKGQGDNLEGIITLDNAIYIKAECPIYCMCSYCDDEIKNGYLNISNQCINEFNCFNGFAVILDWKKFEERLPSLNCNGHKYVYQRVEYKISRGLEDYLDIVEPKNQEIMKPLFIKHPFFSHQKEYRIAVDDPLYEGLFPDNDVHITYSFPMNLKDIGYYIYIPEYLSKDGVLHIPVANHK